jgi:hypothetical protein
MKQNRLIEWMKRPWGLAITAMAVFGAVAVIPWAKAAVKASQSEGGLTIEKIKKEHHDDSEKKEYMDKKMKDPGEVKTAFLADGGLYTAGKAGVFFQKDGVVKQLKECAVMDPRGIAKVGDTLVILDKKSILHQKAGGAWERTESELEAHTLVLGSDGYLYAPGKMGVKRSQDGRTWETVISPEALKQAAEG